MPARSVSRFCVALASGTPVTPAPAAGPIGGKARSLLRLREAGLAVPPAFAVTTELFAALRSGGPPLPRTLSGPDALEIIAEAAAALRAAPWPDGFLDELGNALAALSPGARVCVRSSADTEDDPDALAPGLYTSRVAIPVQSVEAALRQVLATALTPAAVAYLGARGRSPDQVPMAVLVHPFVPGTATGTAALDARPGAQVVIEARGALAPRLRGQLEVALATLTSRWGASEVEWVAEGDAPLFLQLRPYRAPTRTPREPLPEEQAGWRWDASHNPVPLSPAQAGLVALADARCAVPFGQRVIGGYLFYRATEPTADEPPADARAALERLRESAAARLAAPESLEQALETFLAVYQPLFAVVQPAARAAKDALAMRLARMGLSAREALPPLLASVTSAASARAALARQLAGAATEPDRAAARAAYVAAFGDEAAVWDVAAPTWREQPAAIPVPAVRLDGPVDEPRAAAGATQIRERLSAGERAEWDRLVAAARTAAAVGEDDDAFYARLQTHVRRALLAEGDRLVAAGVLERTDDVFWLPLELVRRLARGEATVGAREAAEQIAAARAADAAARARPPRLEAADGAPEGWVRGRGGSPGACIGVVRHWPLASGATPTDADARGEAPVIVARTILPTELPLVTAAALVVETGGVLDHVAAQARERGIPAVVGARGALAALPEGARVLVDGDTGLVAPLP